jgi:CubicO group peptidase (beta-lactamase class C family)
VVSGREAELMGGLSPEVDPAEVGLDPARLERIDRHFRKYVDDGRLPGWLITLSRHGKLAYVRAYGQRDIEAGLPVETDTIWRIYSMTKPVTSVAAMILYEEGAYQLTDPVSRFIPSFADVRVFAGGSDIRAVTIPAAEPVRIWHLLTHTSGLTYGFHRSHPVDAMYRGSGFEWGTPRKADLAACCDLWAGLPLLFQPGAEWNYSVATDVLGRVIEVAAGVGLDEFLAQRVFAPLGMTETGFWLDEADRDRLAALYSVGPGGTAVRLESLGVVGVRGQPEADVPRGRRRACLDGGRLPPVYFHAASHAGQPGGRTRRRPGAQPAHRRVHDAQPPARRRGPRDVRPAAVRRGAVQRRWVRARVRRAARPRPRSDRR